MERALCLIWSLLCNNLENIDEEKKNAPNEEEKPISNKWLFRLCNFGSDCLEQIEVRIY